MAAAALISAALASIAEHGTANLSLREVARRAGVSHAAPPAHHFGDKTGLLTAVGFATAHPAHFEVMFRPDPERLARDVGTYLSGTAR